MFCVNLTFGEFCECWQHRKEKIAIICGGRSHYELLVGVANGHVNVKWMKLAAPGEAAVTDVSSLV